MRPSGLLIGLIVLLPACALVGLPGSNVRGCYPCNAGVPAVRDDDAPLTRFVAIGDFGTAARGRNRMVAKALQQYLASDDVHTERVFELGDNFYSHGLIGARLGCGDLPSPPAAIREQALSVLQPFEFLRDSGITLTAVPGNHDYGCGGRGLVNQLDIDRWLPPPHQWGERWQVVSGLPHEIVLGDGTVQVIALDSTRMINERRFRAAAVERLEDLLQRGRERYRWRLLMAHHPLHTNGLHDGAWWRGTVNKISSFAFLPSHFLAALEVPPFDLLNEEAYSIRYVQYREAVETAVQRSGVSVALFLAGHDHELQLLKPAAPGQPLTLVSGSAAKCTVVRAGGDTLFAAAKNGFAAVTAYADHLDVDFVGTTGCSDRAQCASGTDGTPHPLFHYSIPRPL